MRRMIFDIVLFASCAAALYFLPDRVFPPVFQSFATKVLEVSAGFLHAHIMRQLAFPYIDFSDANTPKEHKYLVIVIYAMVIFGYARG